MSAPKWIEIAETVANLASKGHEDAREELRRMAKLADLVPALQRQWDDLWEALAANMEALETYVEWHNSFWPESEKVQCRKLTKDLYAARAVLARVEKEGV